MLFPRRNHFGTVLHHLDIIDIARQVSVVESIFHSLVHTRPNCPISVTFAPRTNGKMESAASEKFKMILQSIAIWRYL